jgi:hypothetical protein
MLWDYKVLDAWIDRASPGTNAEYDLAKEPGLAEEPDLVDLI